MFQYIMDAQQNFIGNVLGIYWKFPRWDDRRRKIFDVKLSSSSWASPKMLGLYGRIPIDRMRTGVRTSMTEGPPKMFSMAFFRHGFRDPYPDAPCMEYLPTKLGHYWGKCR